MTGRDPGPGHPHPHPHAHDHPHDHPHGRGPWPWLRSLLLPHSHDSADSVDDELEGSTQGIRAVKISLIVLGATALVQALIVGGSGSVALLADTVHNLSDALTAVPLWIAFALSRRAASGRYTYGYGRAEDLAGLFVVAMIAVSAVVTGWQAIDRLLHPQPVSHLPWVAAAAIVGFAGNELVAVYRIRVGRQIGSAALVADGLHARTDGLTSLAVLIGAAGVALGWPAADPVVGLLITAAILLILRTATRDVFRRLMDGVDPDLLREADASLRHTAGVEDVRSLRMRWSGHRMQAEADIEVAPELTVEQSHRIAHHAEAHLIRHLPRVGRVTIHVSPTGAHHHPDLADVS
jgi:cation diffusion facilitator family transporter